MGASKKANHWNRPRFRRHSTLSLPSKKMIPGEGQSRKVSALGRPESLYRHGRQDFANLGVGTRAPDLIPTACAQSNVGKLALRRRHPVGSVPTPSLFHASLLSPLRCLRVFPRGTGGGRECLRDGGGDPGCDSASFAIEFARLAPSRSSSLCSSSSSSPPPPP